MEAPPCGGWPKAGILGFRLSGEEESHALKVFFCDLRSSKKFITGQSPHPIQQIMQSTPRKTSEPASDDASNFIIVDDMQHLFETVDIRKIRRVDSPCMVAELQMREDFIMGSSVSLDDNAGIVDLMKGVMDSDGIKGEVIGVNGTLRNYIAILVDDEKEVVMYDRLTNDYAKLASNGDCLWAGKRLVAGGGFEQY